MMISIKRMGCVLAVLALSLMLTACFDPPTAMIGGDSADQTSRSTRATVAVPAGQMTLSDLMGCMNSTMSWSSLSGFTHEVTGESQAVFQVADTYGKEAVLIVTYHEATDTVSKAELSYGNVSVSILTNDTMVLRKILVAMDEED